MGTHGRLLVYGAAPDRQLTHALARLTELERRWSRFRPDSEISRINSAQGEPVSIEPDTLMLLSRAIHGWRASGGLFDPTVGPAMIAHGYDRDFAEVGGSHAPTATGATAGCGGIRLDSARGTVQVPAGTSLDLGGIGKGLAADLVAAELLQRGGTGVLVDIGGDLRMAGSPPSGGWTIAVEDPRRPGHEWLRLSLAAGGMATSSTLRRRWRQGEMTCHHVIDPRTGRPAAGTTVAVTAVAQEAWWAEVVATSLLLAPKPEHHPLAGTVEYISLGADGAVCASSAMAAVAAA